jgi:hypothetical protein
MVHQQLEPRVLVSLVINLVINTQGSHKVGLPFLSCVWPALQLSRPQLHNSICVLKVKCTLVQALRLCTGRTALEGGEGSASRPGRSLPPEKNPVPIVQEAGWAPGPVWTHAKNLAPPVFDQRTVQPVISLYVDWATRPTFCVLRF